MINIVANKSFFLSQISLISYDFCFWVGKILWFRSNRLEIFSQRSLLDEIKGCQAIKSVGEFSNFKFPSQPQNWNVSLPTLLTNISNKWISQSQHSLKNFVSFMTSNPFSKLHLPWILWKKVDKCMIQKRSHINIHKKIIPKYLFRRKVFNFLLLFSYFFRQL